MNTRATFPFPWKFTLERNFHFVNSTINFILMLISILKSRTQWTNFFRRKIILLINFIFGGRLYKLVTLTAIWVNGTIHGELRSRWKRFRLVSKVFDREEGRDRITQSWLMLDLVNEGNLGQFDVRTVHTQVLVLERKSNVYKYRIDEIIFVRLLLIRFILHFLKISMKDSYECSYIGVRKLMAWTWLEEDKESFHDGATIFDWICFQR